MTLHKKPIESVDDLEKEVKKILLLKDKGVVKVVCATIIAQKMDLDPVWLMLVAPSSGGKTEFINAISGLEFVHPISDITVNTFMSGQQRTGKETSLLLKIQNGIFAFKDFTSILAKNRESRAEIMKQLREIYDGEYVKRTGTGDDPSWRGKMGAIAGVTESIYQFMADMSSMGDRFIMYNIEQPDREQAALRMLQNAKKMTGHRIHMKYVFTSYINHVLSKLDEMEEDIILTEEQRIELLDVADFATRVRSAVLTNFKTGLVEFVPSKEMPMRMISQLNTIAASLLVMKKADPSYDGVLELSLDEKKILYKIAFDSIPRTRRDVLYPLAQFRGGISTAGLAVKLNLPTASARQYLEQVNALGICRRQKRNGPQGDYWHMHEKYRKIMVKLEGINVLDKELIDENSMDEDEAAEQSWDNKEDWPKVDIDEADYKGDINQEKLM